MANRKTKDGYNFEQLKQHVLAGSVSQVWAIAVTEWDVENIDESDEPWTCKCGHSPIYDHCTIRNRLTNCELVIGNVCVKKFNGFELRNILQCLRRVRENNLKALNRNAVSYFVDTGVLQRRENIDFLLKTTRKQERHLSERDEFNRRRLSQYILAAHDKRVCKEPPLANRFQAFCGTWARSHGPLTVYKDFGDQRFFIRKIKDSWRVVIDDMAFRKTFYTSELACRYVYENRRQMSLQRRSVTA